MHLHQAYGLAIASEFALPELAPSDFALADVTIRRQSVGRRARTRNSTLFEFGPREAYLAWSEVGAFLVEDGKTILADLCAGTSDELTRLPLLGAVLAVLLHQRGLLVLHASAVAVAGQAVMVIGGKGAGKSTVAAALLARGHRLIADDVVAVECATPDGPRLLPGYPQLKLSLAAATIVLGEQGDELAPIHPWSEKRCCRVDESRFADQVTPPARIYTLVRGEPLSETRVTPQEALMSLLGHSYMARFGDQVLHGAAASIHLQQCVTLASCAPVSQLVLADALQDLDRAAYLVEARLAQASPTSPAHL